MEKFMPCTTFRLAVFWLLLATAMPPLFAADDPLRDQATALNRINGNTAMAKKLGELLKD